MLKLKKDVNKLREERNLNFNGKYKPEKYEALQKQRLNERKIRAEKKEINTLESELALHPENYKKLQSEILLRQDRVKVYQADQRVLIKQYSNLERRYDREALGNRVTFGAEKSQDLTLKSNGNTINAEKPIEKLSNEELTKQFLEHFDGNTAIIDKMVDSANIEDVNVYKIFANSYKLEKISIGKARGTSSYRPGIKNEILLSNSKDVGTAYHEYGHSLDHLVAKDEKYATEKGNFHWVSDKIQDVRIETRKELNNTIPKELIDVLQPQKDKIITLVKNDLPDIKSNIIEKITKQYASLPTSIKEQIANDELQEEIKKAVTKYASKDEEYQKWSIVSDIYDAITDGSAKNSDVLTGSHGATYYRTSSIISFMSSGKVEKQNTEIFANFVELKMLNCSEQLDFMKKNISKLYEDLEERFEYVAKYLEEM